MHYRLTAVSKMSVRSAEENVEQMSVEHGHWSFHSPA